jgi:hypothetical protein
VFSSGKSRPGRHNAVTQPNGAVFGNDLKDGLKISVAEDHPFSADLVVVHNQPFDNFNLVV